MDELDKQLYLTTPVRHIDIKEHNVAPLVEAYGHMAFQARNLARAARIYEKMLQDRGCGVILCLAGSLVSAGLKQVIVDMIRHDMVDAIVSTGANLIDQDLLEALGFRHYQGSVQADDNALRQMAIDRIYDTYIDEDELRQVDFSIAQIADQLPARPYSSREFLHLVGAWLAGDDPFAGPSRLKAEDSILLAAYQKGVPLFCPAFSDCSAGFGLVIHQTRNPDSHLTIDSVRDFRELTQLKLHLGETGLVMLGGGVPKNFVQDVVVAADLLGRPVPMHRYAVQITVADERDGALSGSTLKEANSWGKVDLADEQMVFGEATTLFPLLVGYAYHRRAWAGRGERRLSELFSPRPEVAGSNGKTPRRLEYAGVGEGAGSPES
jgi:deoxyhypusine synthase